MAGEEAYVIGLFVSFGVLLIGLAFVVTALNKAKRDRTKTYRKAITDLYIVGRVKQMADKDGVNLTNEKIDYDEFSKKQSREREPEIDDAIEDEIIESLSNKKNKK